MTDPEFDDTTVARVPADDRGSADAAASTETPVATAASTDAPVQYGIGPFSLREVIIGGVWLVAFVLSFFPLVPSEPRAVFSGASVWSGGLSWILAIGVPTVAVFLLALRRLSPQGIRRVGSLGIDQFASVAFAVAATVWVTWLWETVAIAIQYDTWTRTWVLWVETVLMLAGVVLTVFAPIIPGLEQDFQDRPEIPAHRNARPVRAVVPRPRRERPAPAPRPAPASSPAASEPAAAPAADDDRPAERDPSATDVFAPLNDTGAHEPQADAATREWTPADEPTQVHAAPQAFWALAPVERDVLDEYGTPLFRIGPTAWALVIEDRGDVFVIRHDDGRIGYLHDVSGVTRG